VLLHPAWPVTFTLSYTAFSFVYLRRFVKRMRYIARISCGMTVSDGSGRRWLEDLAPLTRRAEEAEPLPRSSEV
jgi:hypothetical protein